MADPREVMRDKQQVRDNLYGDPAKFNARADLQSRFRTNPISVTEWELGLVDVSQVRSALDVGCGTGVFLLPLARRLAPQGARVVGLDLAEGTLGVARSRVAAEGLPVECLIGDVEALPFDDATFDLALANYMLYHVPDLERAIAELRRVLRAGGTLLAATNGERHMRELWEIAYRAFVRVGIAPAEIGALMTRGRSAGAMSFRLENGGEALGRHFAEVRLERFPDELRVTEVEPLLAYFTSLWSLDLMLAALAPAADPAALRAGVEDAFRAIARERIAAEGAVRIQKDTGAFIAR